MGMVIGDVSGKGAPAAIYAALVSGILRSHAPIEPGPAEMLRAVNFSLGERRIDGQFVSLIYAVWDDESRSLQVANSGLPRPLYCHDGKIEVDRSHRPASWDCLTMPNTTSSPSKPNRETCSSFSVTAFSTPATRPEICSDAPGWKTIVAGCAEISADCVVKSLFKAVTEHAGGEEAFDDETVVAIKVKGEPKRK